MVGIRPLSSRSSCSPSFRRARLANADDPHHRQARSRPERRRARRHPRRRPACGSSRRCRCRAPRSSRAGRATSQDALRDLKADPDVIYAELDRRRSRVADRPDFGPGASSNTAQICRRRLGSGHLDADSDVLEAWDAGRDRRRADRRGRRLRDRRDHPDLDPAASSSGYNFVDDGERRAPTTATATGRTSPARSPRRATTARASPGVAPEARILPLRVLDDDGNGMDADIVDAFDYAGDAGVRIVNASLGGDGDRAGARGRDRRPAGHAVRRRRRQRDGADSRATTTTSTRTVPVRHP